MSINTVGLKVEPRSSDSTGYLDNSANVIVSPKSAKGISGFVFDIPERESIDLSSDITDHFTESNSYLNDHEVRKPVIITLSGFVGELVYREPEGIQGTIQDINNRLGTVEAYLGDLTPGFVQEAEKATLLAESAISKINQTVDRFQNVVDLFDGEGAEDTLQQKAFNNLYSLWKSSTLLTVLTPWRYFDNMRMTNIGFTQDSDSEEITNIVVTLKQLRFAEVGKTDFSGYIDTPREEVQIEDTEDIGKVQGREESFLFSAIGASL